METETRMIEAAPEAYSYPLLIKQLLHTPLIYAGDREIVYRDKRRFSYQEFFDRVKKLGSGLKALGVKPGDVVAFMDWDSYRYLEAYFAVPSIGAVLHCVNIRLSPETDRLDHEPRRRRLRFRPRFLVALGRSHKRANPLSEKMDIDEGRRNRFRLGKEIRHGVTKAVLADGSSDFEFPDFDEKFHGHHVLYQPAPRATPRAWSSATGKLVLHTLGMLAATGSLPPEPWVNSADVYMPITPMFHVHAWGMPYLATVLGLKQVYPGQYEPGMLLNLLVREKVTFSHCVPTILQMILSSPATKDIDFSGWKVIIGGSALTKGLARQAMDRGIQIFAGYGMSETCPVLTLAIMRPEEMKDDPEKQMDIRTATGRPVPLVDLKIVDSENRPLPADGQTAGEIVVRTPWLTQTYYNNPGKGAELWADGYLHTGDVAVMTPDGYVKITDRLKDVIKTGGEWVSSLEVENIISQHPSVAETAVVGVPDEKWGERPLAMVIPKEG